MSIIRFGEIKLNELESRCRAQGVPLTIQRRLILEELAGRCDHPTADQMYDAVTTRNPAISRTTVYRVLDAFVQLGVARKVSNPEAKTRYDADTRRHHHLVCSVCHKVTDFSTEELDRITIPLEIGDGFAVADYSLTVTGLCADCRNSELSSTRSGRSSSRHIPHRRIV